MRLLRAQGRYGPRFREVLPALTGLALAVCGTVAAVTVAHRTLGPAALAAPALLCALAVPFLLQRRRPAARRRRGRYTEREIAELDTRGLALAVARMLRRDGWTVRLPPGDHVRPCVRARHPRGHRLEVAFRPVAEPLPDEEPRPVPRTGARAPVRLIVHRGDFGCRDRRWASGRANIRLLDGTLLRRWADGAPLDELIDLDAAGEAD